VAGRPALRQRGPNPILSENTVNTFITPTASGPGGAAEQVTGAGDVADEATGSKLVADLGQVSAGVSLHLPSARRK
jgi:hypothetical protein